MISLPFDINDWVEKKQFWKLYGVLPKMWIEHQLPKLTAVEKIFYYEVLAVLVHAYIQCYC